MDAQRTLEYLLTASIRLAVIQCDDPEQLIDGLRGLFNRTGQACYHWDAANGLRRIAIEHIPIPQTHRPADALEHILASQHFGIYLLCGFQATLRDRQVIEQLEQVACDQGPVRKLVLLATDGATHLPERILALAEQIALV